MCLNERACMPQTTEATALEPVPQLERENPHTTTREKPVCQTTYTVYPYWYVLQYGWTLKMLCKGKKARHKRALIVRFHLYEMSRIGKSIDTESRSVVDKREWWASLVVQWLRIRLPMQGTRVWALVREDPTCLGTTKPVSHNYWACALEPTSYNYWSPCA